MEPHKRNAINAWVVTDSHEHVNIELGYDGPEQ